MNERRTATLSGELAGDEPVALPTGTVVAGRFELRALLGRGGFGVVYEAWDRELRRAVALKLLRRDREDAASARRFRSEAALAREVFHPNLVRVFDIGADGDRLFLSLELVDGPSLADRLEDSGPLAIDETVEVAGKLLEALAALHAAGIVHRDVKPSNVLLPRGADGAWEVKLGDLGMARRLDPEATRATIGPALVGTLRYLPPEVVRGGEAGPASDLYSLGLTLVETLGARDPGATDDTLTDLLSRQRAAPRAAKLRAARADLPRWLADWLVALLEPDPAKRCPAATSALADLRRRRSPTAKRRGARRLLLGLALAASAIVVGRGLSGGDSSRYSGLRTDPDGAVVAHDTTGRALWSLPASAQADAREIALVRLGEKGGTALARTPYGRNEVVRLDAPLELQLLDPESGRKLRTVRLGAPNFGDVMSGFEPTFEVRGTRALDLDGDGIDEIVVVLNHLPSWPSVVLLYEPEIDRGRQLFLAGGHQDLLSATDLDGDGRKEILFTGVGNRLRRSRTMSAVRVQPWIGDGAIPLHHTPAMSAELGSVRNLAWQAIVDPRGIVAATAEPGRRELRLQLEVPSLARLRFDGTDPALSPARGPTESATWWRAYEEIAEALRFERSEEWSLSARLARKAAGSARAGLDPALATVAERIEAMATIRAGDAARGLARIEELAGASPNPGEIAYDAAEALHLAGRPEPAIEWYRRATGEGGAAIYGKSKKDILLGEVTALAEVGRADEARRRIDWYQSAYGWDEGVYDAGMRAYLDWRAGRRGGEIAPYAIPPLGRGWEWRYVARETSLARGADSAELLAEVNLDLPQVSEGKGLFLLLRAELLHRLGRDEEARASAAEGERRFDPGHELLEYALRDLAAERIGRFAGR